MQKYAEFSKVDENWTCVRKTRYETAAEAERKLAADVEAGYRPRRYYQCRFCGGFHFTTKPVKK